MDRRTWISQVEKSSVKVLQEFHICGSMELATPLNVIKFNMRSRSVPKT